MKKFVIITPDAFHGSFGDQAMMVALIRKIREKYENAKITLFNTYNSVDDKIISLQYEEDVVNIFPKNDLVTDFIDTISDCDAVFLVGADVLDGAYGLNASLCYYKLMDIAQKLGKTVHVQGFSFNNTADPILLSAVKTISKHVPLKVRDIDSFNRLKKIGCKHLVQVADMGFSFDETPYKKSLFAYELYDHLLEAKQYNGKTLIGIHVYMKKSEDYKTFIQKLIYSLKQFPNVFAVLLPHDKRCFGDEKYSDDEMNSMLERELTKEGIECINANKLRNEIDVKYILGLIDLVITCRMHLAIASLSKNVPVISFGYQDKFKGLYKFYKFKHNLLFYKDTFEASDLISAIDFCLNNDLRTRIKRKNKKVFKLSEKNFQFNIKHFKKKLNISVSYEKSIEHFKSRHFNFISLGCNCFPRTVLTWWNMKPKKSEGEMSMPFDLAIHPIDSIIKILKNNFSDYLDNLQFDSNTGYWHNTKYNIVFNHDQTLVNENDFKQRYLARIDNFKNSTKKNKPGILCLLSMGI